MKDWLRRNVGHFLRNNVAAGLTVGVIKRRSRVSAEQAMMAERALHERQQAELRDATREATEAFVRSAVTDAMAAVDAVHKRHVEALEARVQLGVSQVASYADERIHREAMAAVDEVHKRHVEALEARVQLGVSQVASYADERIHREAMAAVDAVHRRHVEALEARVQLGVSQMASYADEHAYKFARDLRDLRQHIPAFLNATATVPALAFELAALVNQRTSDLRGIEAGLEDIREKLKGEEAASIASRADRSDLWKAAERADHSIGDLWQRLEFVRKEIMYEVRFGSDISRKTKTLESSRIVNQDKIDIAKRKNNIRLNVGCGHVPLESYINVDFRDLPGVDVIADVGSLPFHDGDIQEISSSHVLEHFPQEHLRRLLPYWRGLLQSGGKFRAVVPDGEAMLANIKAGGYSFEDFRLVFFGAQEYEGEYHFNMFTPDSLNHLLNEAGFYEVTVLAKGRKNELSFEFEITAVAP